MGKIKLVDASCPIYALYCTLSTHLNNTNVKSHEINFSLLLYY